MPPQLGQDFGGYRVDGVIGRGGMGVVYRAWQHRVQRPVALKVLPPEFAEDPAYRHRFGREAAALARLDSPHVIQIYDHGEVDGHLYLAMQLVNGPDLSRVLADGPLPPRRALAVVAQVASALGDAHAIGIVHRDVKTGNVLLRPRAEHHDEDFAYLCDFGIARSAADVTSGPETGGIVGTLGYLAPERLGGGPATVATDVYALGCLLWATLTGAPPYGGSQPQVIMAHVEGPVPQLAADDPRTELLNELLAAMLAKDAASRPSVREIRDRIRDIRDGLPGQPVAPAPRRPTAHRRRRPLVVAAAVAVVVAVAAVLVVALTPGPAGSATERIASSTPQGVSCAPVAAPEGVLAQAVCRPGADVGELRIAALDSADSALAHLRDGAGQDPSALTSGSCPDDLPARATWQRDGHGGTLVCFVLGSSTRYAWTDDERATVSVLDGAPGTPFPRDLDAVEDFFSGTRYG